MSAYLATLKLQALVNQLPGAFATGLIWAVMALGVYLTFRMLDVADLTVDGSLSTGGAVCIMLVLNGCDYQTALLAAFGAGLLCGLVTGILHTVLGIPAILAGILTQISLYSINLNIMGRANQSVPVFKYIFYFTSNSNYLTRTIILSAVLCAFLVLIIYLYLNTEHGSALRATGVNGNMARAQGINTNVMKVIGLSLSNGLVALCGALISQYSGFADVNSGRGAIVIGLAAVIIGEVLGDALFRKHMTLLLRLVFVVIGSVIYYLVYTFVIWLKLPSENMKLLTAIVVALFLAVPYLKSQSKNSFSNVARRNAKASKEVH